MKVENLLKKINDKISKLEGETVEFGDLHNEIHDIINTFKEYNIGYNCWSVFYKNKDVYGNLFTLDVNSKDDKRCKYIRKGKILKIEFMPYDEDILKMDYKNLKSFFIKKDLKHNLEKQRNYIEDLEDKLQKAKIGEKKIEAELKNELNLY